MADHVVANSAVLSGRTLAISTELQGLDGIVGCGALVTGPGPRRAFLPIFIQKDLDVAPVEGLPPLLGGGLNGCATVSE